MAVTGQLWSSSSHSDDQRGKNQCLKFKCWRRIETAPFSYYWEAHLIFPVVWFWVMSWRMTLFWTGEEDEPLRFIVLYDSSKTMFVVMARGPVAPAESTPDLFIIAPKPHFSLSFSFIAKGTVKKEVCCFRVRLFWVKMILGNHFPPNPHVWLQRKMKFFGNSLPVDRNLRL